MSLRTQQPVDTATPFMEDTDRPLIGPDEPPPFEVVNRAGRAPFLLVCDHASPVIPRALKQLGVADWVLERHVACDIGARAATLALSERFDAPAVLANYSRLVVDLNRKLHDASAFIKVSDGIAIPGNIELTERERQARIKTFFDPYHDAVDAELRRFKERGQVPGLVSIHTCTPVFNRVVRRWHVGVMWDKDPRIAKPLLERLAAMPDICPGDNEPYSGTHPNDFTVDHHAEQNGLPCVGIELRQDLVDSADGAIHWAGILGDALEPVLANPTLYTRRGE
ncbi:MAG: N-formylglutamate amidohydrolase [Pseudomonadota bacterium]